MKTIKVSEATNIQLDWLVAEAKGIPQFVEQDGTIHDAELVEFGCDGSTALNYTTNPALMYPIIYREKIATLCPASGDFWNARKSGTYVYYEGPTPLIAAARCFIVSKLGETVEVPGERA
jgi:hypothetical protein